MAKLAINPQILSWAIDNADVSLERVCIATGRELEIVQSWISGDTEPTKGDVQKIGRLLGRSLQFFFLSKPPEESPAVARFRSAIDGSSLDPTQELNAIRRASRLQRIARAGLETHNEDAVSLPRITSNPNNYAAIMREFLGWDTRRDQIATTSKSATFKSLRRRIESLDIVVVYLDMGEGNCRGFSLTDKVAPLIAINSAYSNAALKSFTLLHELGHLAKGSGSVCHFEDTAEERWCDRFASAFLLPEQEVLEYFSYKQWNRVTTDNYRDRVRLTSGRFKASWKSVALRLKELGLADQNVVDVVFSGTDDMQERAGFNPNGGRRTPEIRLDYFGRTFTRSVLNLYDHDSLSEFDTRRYLNVNSSELQAVRSLLAGDQ
ncbi:ImmA/IrrE family metallo-endopeptidase [Glutamicibacter nicotianae]|uniref:IrrE N-terminal-like domain-containing protein n=1 Tax=Glutamicibacter nicotianae TaxID=37929 RepID=A0ABQ0RJW3_GLUNI|nr:ImmA/IrrE family metallo-endopeptidase [Glutamicibacter nicotianae]GEC12095.1 hypothetical protein ANI01nite_12980 [Glutamicibacter nicotianae]